MLLSKSIVPASPSWEYPFKADWLDRAFAQTMISGVVPAITSDGGTNPWLTDAAAVDIDAFVGSTTEHRVWFRRALRHLAVRPTQRLVMLVGGGV